MSGWLTLDQHIVVRIPGGQPINRRVSCKHHRTATLLCRPCVANFYSALDPEGTAVRGSSRALRSATVPLSAGSLVTWAPLKRAATCWSSAI